MVARCDRSTASPYSLNSYSTSLLARLNRAAKAATAANQRSKGRQFLALPKNLPSVNPYAWPPDKLFGSSISSAYSKVDKVRPIGIFLFTSHSPQLTFEVLIFLLLQDAPAPVPNLFRLSRANLRALILAAGRKEVPGYEAEKKRLASVCMIRKSIFSQLKGIKMPFYRLENPINQCCIQ